MVSAVASVFNKLRGDSEIFYAPALLALSEKDVGSINSSFGNGRSSSPPSSASSYTPSSGTYCSVLRHTLSRCFPAFAPSSSQIARLASSVVRKLTTPCGGFFFGSYSFFLYNVSVGAHTAAEAGMMEEEPATYEDVSAISDTDAARLLGQH